MNIDQYGIQNERKQPRYTRYLLFIFALLLSAVGHSIVFEEDLIWQSGQGSLQEQLNINNYPNDPLSNAIAREKERVRREEELARQKKLQKENEIQEKLQKELIAFYSFDGNANDLSGNANHGMEYGGVGYVSGVKGLSANFDGYNDYIEIMPRSNVSRIGDFTISAWVYLNSWKNQLYKGKRFDRQYIFDGHCKSSSARGNLRSPGFGVIADNSNGHEEQHNFLMYNDTNTYIEPYASVSLSGDWHHIVFMRRGKDDITYLDGKKLPTRYLHNKKRAGDESINMKHPWYIGTYCGNNFNYNRGKFNYSFSGLIDELRIYDRALSVSEINRLYEI